MAEGMLHKIRELGLEGTMREKHREGYHTVVHAMGPEVLGERIEHAFVFYHPQSRLFHVVEFRSGQDTVRLTGTYTLGKFVEYKLQRRLAFGEEHNLEKLVQSLET